MARHSKGEGEIEIFPDLSLHHEARLLQLSCEKALQGLGWSPRWDFDHTVEMTINWYKQVKDGLPALTITTDQIEHYMGS